MNEKMERFAPSTEESVSKETFSETPLTSEQVLDNLHALLANISEEERDAAEINVEQIDAVAKDPKMLDLMIKAGKLMGLTGTLLFITACSQNPIPTSAFEVKPSIGQTEKDAKEVAVDYASVQHFPDGAVVRLEEVASEGETPDFLETEIPTLPQEGGAYYTADVEDGAYYASYDKEKKFVKVKNGIIYRAPASGMIVTIKVGKSRPYTEEK